MDATAKVVDPETGSGTGPGAARNLFFMALLGFASGLPLALSGFTLRQWLSEEHVALGLVGLTANLGLAYLLKFLWAPLLDQVVPLPGFGRRRAWLLTVQPLVAAAILWLALGNPAGNMVPVFAAGALVALFSATQDIAIDAWRIETFPAARLGVATAAYVWGYRAAMLVSGSGAILLAGVLGWRGSLLTMAALMAGCMLVTWLAPEPAMAPRHHEHGFAARLREGVVEPLREFVSRRGAWVMLGYVALFKLGEALAGVMLPSFYRAMGFDRAVVAVAVGPLSLPASLAGIAVGGWLVARIRLGPALIATGLFQMAIMGLYVVLAFHPAEGLLYATSVAETFVESLADAAYLTYLSLLCAPAFTATQYALLSSIAPLPLRTLGGLSGFLAAALGWKLFYSVAMLSSLPGMILMLVILRWYPPPAKQAA